MDNFVESPTIKEKAKLAQNRRNYVIDVDKYILVHVDGRSFSKMVKNKFEKPFDRTFINMMNETAIYLCENIQCAKIAYVQSDEISLLIKKDNPESDIFFGGRLCKMQSIIASLATSKFNQLATIEAIKSHANYYVSEKDKLGPADVFIYSVKDAVDFMEVMPIYQFDCKVWDVDTANDAFAWFLFRNIDCVKNSKQQFVQTYLPHKILLKHNTDEQVLMAIDEKGKDWKSCSEDEKYGRIISKEEYEFTTQDGTQYIRSKWVAHDGTDLTDVDNRNKFLEKYNFF